MGMAWAFGFGVGGGTPPPLDPTSIAGLLAWHRADLGVTIGTGVSAWADQSGTGDSNKNMTQATGSKQPTLNASDAAYNNQKTLSVAATQFLASGTWASAPAQPLTVIVVGQIAGGAGQQFFFDGITAAEMALFVPGGGGTMDIYAGAVLGAACTTNAPSVWCAQFNGATSKVFVNDHATPIASGNAGTAAPLGFTYGANFLGGNSGIGKIAEVAVWDHILSPADMNTMFVTYMGARYGISTT